MLKHCDKPQGIKGNSSKQVRAAPEIVKGHDYDWSSDVWLLGRQLFYSDLIDSDEDEVDYENWVKQFKELTDETIKAKFDKHQTC